MKNQCIKSKKENFTYHDCCLSCWFLLEKRMKQSNLTGRDVSTWEYEVMAQTAHCGYLLSSASSVAWQNVFRAFHWSIKSHDWQQCYFQISLDLASLCASAKDSLNKPGLSLNETAKTCQNAKWSEDWPRLRLFAFSVLVS
jgi:hypothetical protein